MSAIRGVPTAPHTAAVHAIHSSRLVGHIDVSRWHVLPLAFVAVVAVGCSGAGEGQSCGFFEPCASGLSCSWDTATCQGPVKGLDLAGQCDPADAGCGAGESGFLCHGFASADAEPFETDCRVAGQESFPGDAIYCCTDIPHCVDVLSCSAASDSGQGFFCQGDATPTQTVPSLLCAETFSYGDTAEYCCSTVAGCFAATSFACADAGQPVVCVGSPAPAQLGLPCAPAGSDEDGSTYGIYCCAPEGGPVDGGTDDGKQE